jgi:hypothetical protein
MKLVRSVVERIVALAKAGNPPRVIYGQLDGNIPVDDIIRIVCAARANGEAIPYFRGPAGRSASQRTVIFSVETLDRLAPHARRRGITINELARQLVEEALDANLVDGILDDAEEAA